MKTIKKPPSEREYLHDDCGEVTVVSGSDFVGLCDPRLSVNETFCSHCDDFDKLKAFRWSDTDESLSEYRKRLRQLIPLYVRIAGASWIFLVCIILGLVTGCLMTHVVQDVKKAFGIPMAVFFVIAMVCDAIGKLSKQETKFHQYR